MTMAFTDEQEQLRDALRRLFTDTCRTSQGRLERALPDVRSKVVGALAGAGMAGLPFPEDLGGAGAGLVETAILFHEGGRVLCPSSVYTTILTGLAILRAGTAEAKARWVPAIARGDLVATLALWSSDDARKKVPTVRAEPGDAGSVLHGTAWYVENLQRADVVLVAARAGDDVALVLVPRGTPGATVEPVEMLGRDPVGHLRLDSCVVPADAVVGVVRGDELDRIAEVALALQCVEMVGGADRVLDDTVEYAKQRHQFGRPIGSFQAVQHIVADLRIGLDVARLTAWQAVARVACGAPAARETAIAKLHANRAYPRTTLQCHQLMGGMGYLRESDLHLWSERAKVGELSNGSVNVALGWLADGLPGTNGPAPAAPRDTPVRAGATE